MRARHWDCLEHAQDNTRCAFKQALSALPPYFSSYYGPLHHGASGGVRVAVQKIPLEISLAIIFQVIFLPRADGLYDSGAALLVVISSDSAAPVAARLIFFYEAVSENKNIGYIKPY